MAYITPQFRSSTQFFSKAALRNSVCSCFRTSLGTTCAYTVPFARDMCFLRLSDAAPEYFCSLSDSRREEVCREFLSRLDGIPSGVVIKETYHLQGCSGFASPSSLYEVFEETVENTLPGQSTDSRYLDRTLAFFLHAGRPCILYRYYIDYAKPEDYDHTVCSI